MNLKDKMFFELQKTLASDTYKAIDLYEFVKLCQFIDQILRDVNNKFRNINRDDYEDDYEESILRKNLNNQESSREQSNASDVKFRSDTSKSNANNQNSNNREMSQVFAFDQVNAFICYNCDKLDHIARNCKASRKMNSNNHVREIKKNTFENVESKKD
jgi:hypothetical protein